MKPPLAATALFSLASAACALTPAALRCENRFEPLGIEAATPRLSWQLQAESGETGKMQRAYRILVAILGDESGRRHRRQPRTS